MPNAPAIPRDNHLHRTETPPLSAIQDRAHALCLAVMTEGGEIAGSLRMDSAALETGLDRARRLVGTIAKLDQAMAALLAGVRERERQRDAELGIKAIPPSALAMAANPAGAARLGQELADACPDCAEPMGEWEPASNTVGEPIPRQRVRTCSRLGCNHKQVEDVRPALAERRDFNDPFTRQTLTPRREYATDGGDHGLGKQVDVIEGGRRKEAGK